MYKLEIKMLILNEFAKYVDKIELKNLLKALDKLNINDLKSLGLALQCKRIKEGK